MKEVQIVQEMEKQVIFEYRKKYLDSLIAFQELFLEFLVQNGEFFVLKQKKEVVGYVIINEKRTHIVEYYSIFKSAFMNKDILIKVCNHFKISNAYCKTFDTILLNALNLISQEFKVGGILFRNFSLENYDTNPSIHERFARTNDLYNIQKINDGFFDCTEEIEDYIAGSNIILFEDDENQIIGCGLYQLIAKDYDYFDIGMLVNLKYRNQGYGTYIIKRLISICESNGKMPICGCDYENTPSYKTLIKAGFIPEYQILEFLIK